MIIEEAVIWHFLRFAMQALRNLDGIPDLSDVRYQYRVPSENCYGPFDQKRKIIYGSSLDILARD